MSLFEKLRSKLIHAKLFYQRTLGYISLINASMILFLFLSDIEKYGIDIDIRKWYIPLLLVGAFLFILLGYIEDKFGFFKAETEAANRRNPQLSQILEKLEKIEKDIEKLKKIETDVEELKK
jgi:hypothetical protein